MLVTLAGYEMVNIAWSGGDQACKGFY